MTVLNPDDLLKRALGAKYLVISVIGPYAHEEENEMLPRKKLEISKCGYTFWHHQSFQAQPDKVQEMGIQASQKDFPIYLVLVDPANGKKGAVDTKPTPPASHYRTSSNGILRKVPNEIYTETGGTRGKPFALKIRKLKEVTGTIDLWQYSEFGEKRGEALKIRRGGSTICAVRIATNSNAENRIKSHIRRVVAVAEIVKPFSVWLADHRP